MTHPTMIYRSCGSISDWWMIDPFSSASRETRPLRRLPKFRTSLSARLIPGGRVIYLQHRLGHKSCTKVLISVGGFGCLSRLFYSRPSSCWCLGPMLTLYNSGGQGFSGETTCVAGYTCVFVNQWYSQCQLGSNPQPPVTPTSTATGPGPTVNIPRKTFTEITNFGSNPNGVRAWLYVPSTLVANPPIVVAIHWCGGTANDMYQTQVFNTLAEQKGFIVIFPQTIQASNCWDVHSTETLKHNAGGDSLGIVSAVRWTISNFGANRARVYATGISSGAMMTNVLLGAYPDVFAAGSAVAGVPYGCFKGTDAWSTACATGQLIKTPQEWGDLVRSGYPGFSGTRPKMQFWHGTADNVLYYQNFIEETKQWSNVFGASSSPSNTVQNWPVAGWTRYDYGPNVMGISAQGVGHTDITYQSTQIMQWFGL